MATAEEIEYAKKIVKAIKDAQKNDGVKTISITHSERSQVVNIENDLGNLENVEFGSSHPHIIDFETGFRLFSRMVTKIEVVDIGKTIFSKKTKFLRIL